MNVKEIDEKLVKMFLWGVIWFGSTWGSNSMFDLFVAEPAPWWAVIFAGLWVTAVAFFAVRIVQGPADGGGSARARGPFVESASMTPVQLVLNVKSLKAARELLTMAEQKNWVMATA